MAPPSPTLTLAMLCACDDSTTGHAPLACLPNRLSHPSTTWLRHPGTRQLLHAFRDGGTPLRLLKLPGCGCRISVNLFSRIPLSEGVNFVGAMLFGVRKQDLVGGGRSQPPRAAYWDWSGSPGFTIVPSVTQVGQLLPLYACTVSVLSALGNRQVPQSLFLLE